MACPSRAPAFLRASRNPTIRCLEAADPALAGSVSRKRALEAQVPNLSVHEPSPPSICVSATLPRSNPWQCVGVVFRSRPGGNGAVMFALHSLGPHHGSPKGCSFPHAGREPLMLVTCPPVKPPSSSMAGRPRLRGTGPNLPGDRGLVRPVGPGRSGLLLCRVTRLVTCFPLHAPGSTR